METASSPFTENCVRGSMPWCECDCPLNFDIRGFLKCVEAGRFSAAYKLMVNSLIFPAVTARICEGYCMGRCRAGLHLPELERYCLSKIPKAKRGAPAYSIPPKSYSVAVVGGGLSGLTCAQRLASKRYQVTLFERASEVGGKLRSALDPALLQEELELQFKNAPYTLETGREISSLEELSGFDAVYLATGEGGADFGLLSGWDGRCMATRRAGVFLGGALAGANPIQSVSHGKIASISIEKYVQVHRMDGQESSFHRGECVLPDLPRTEAGEPPTGELYTKEEAMAEAGRCRKCNCNICMEACDFLTELGVAGRELDAKCFKCVGAIDLSVHTGIRDILSCDLCGRCSAACPRGVDLRGMMAKYKQDVNRIKKIAPYIYDYYRREMDRAMGEDHLLLLPESGRAKVLLFPGCAVAESSPDYVTGTLELLRRREPEMGVLLGCCGIPAQWAGEQARLEAAQAQIRSDWEQAGRPKVATFCMSCLKTFRDLMPEIPCLTVYELLEEGDLSSPPEGPKLAVFDPCSGRAFPAAHAAVRQAARGAGARLSELPEHGETARCCGVGGHISAANRSLAEKVTVRAAALSPLPYLVYCANCRSTFLTAGKDCVHVMDLVLGITPQRAPLHIGELRRNRARLKEQLLTGADLPEQSEGESFLLEPEVLSKLDRLLISADEAAEVVRTCEKTSARLYQSERDVYLACGHQGAVTCWVEYRREGERFRILNAYKHKMEILGTVQSTG